SGKSEPREVSSDGQLTASTKAGERGEIERAFGEINAEKRQEHRDAAEECVNEKLGRGAVPVFTAPDFDEKERRDETHLVKQKPENKVLGGEGAVEGRLHHQHQRAEST